MSDSQIDDIGRSEKDTGNKDPERRSYTKIKNYINDRQQRISHTSKKILRIINMCAELNKTAGVECLVQFQVNVKAPVCVNCTEFRTVKFNTVLLHYPEEKKVTNRRTNLHSGSTKFTVYEGDETATEGCGLQEQTVPLGSFGVPKIHDSTSPIDSVDSRSCGVSAVAGIVNGSKYGQQKQESLVKAEFKATGAGCDASDKLVIVDAVNTVIDTGDTLLRCDYCQKEFRELKRLQSHIIVHLNENSGTGDKPFTCEFCNKSFSQSCNHLQHIRTHTEEKPFKCEFCEKRFARNSTRNEHVRTHTGEKPVSCHYCDRKFSRTRDRDTHSRTHTGEKPFKCEFCEKSFSQSSARILHVRTHTGEKPFSCENCDRKFGRTNDLDQHSRTHTGEKPFACNFCDKRFARNTNLNAHVRTHTGEKPFICDFCDKRFAQTSALKSHVRTHTGEKPFICDFCDKRFRQLGSRNAHVRTHTGGM